MTQYGDLHLHISTSLVTIGSEYRKLRVLGVRGIMFSEIMIIWGKTVLSAFLPSLSAHGQIPESPRKIKQLNIFGWRTCCWENRPYSYCFGSWKINENLMAPENKERLFPGYINIYVIRFRSRWILLHTYTYMFSAESAPLDGAVSASERLERALERGEASLVVSFQLL